MSEFKNPKIFLELRSSAMTQPRVIAKNGWNGCSPNHAPSYVTHTLCDALQCATLEYTGLRTCLLPD